MSSAVAVAASASLAGVSRRARPVRHVFQPGRSSGSTPPPLVVLVHGLESFSGTWDGVMARVAAQPTPSPSLLAVDLRGHGYTPPGPEHEYGPAALADDVVALAVAHGACASRPFVLVGHSMGGRVAMRAAADHPELLRHVVIEDMDCRARGSEMSETFDYDAMRAFEPTGVSSAAVAEALNAASPSAFDADRVRGYVERGRVLAAPGGRAVSLVQPLGFALAHDRVLASRDGSDSMRRLAEVEPARRPGIHLWRADPNCRKRRRTQLRGGEGRGRRGMDRGVEWRGVERARRGVRGRGTLRAQHETRGVRRRDQRAGVPRRARAESRVDRSRREEARDEGRGRYSTLRKIQYPRANDVVLVLRLGQCVDA